MGRRYSKTPRKTEQREAVFQQEFREDLYYWVETDRRTALRIFKLVEAVMQDPFQGMGKPEPLKFLGSGVWSRRITQEHRLVYVVEQNRIDFVQGRYRYSPSPEYPVPLSAGLRGASLRK